MCHNGGEDTEERDCFGMAHPAGSGYISAQEKSFSKLMRDGRIMSDKEEMMMICMGAAHRHSKVLGIICERGSLYVPV